MNHQPFEPILRSAPDKCARTISKYGMMVAHILLLGLGASAASAQVGETGVDSSGIQVLTRGPVHEAFAGLANYNPSPAMIVRKVPPQEIEELPPELRPEGDNVAWIPGYWGWDDERNDYIWISGIWRALPPGRQWIPGYWNNVDQGYQWVSGYWADSSVRNITYLPQPPKSLEIGPQGQAPSRDHAWTPGSWRWQQNRYAWSQGNWQQGRSDRVWIPSHYVWTPRGYVLVDGYWDYGMDRRGVLYAPVYSRSGSYSRPGNSFSPMVAVGLSALMKYIFLRPANNQYYFGDYYDPRYSRSGIYSPIDYRSRNFGYDPLYSQTRWENRQNSSWENGYAAAYDYLRKNVSARPEAIYSERQLLGVNTVDSSGQQILLAAPLDQLAKSKERPLRIQKLSKSERKQISETEKELRKSFKERERAEKENAAPVGGKKEPAIKPSKSQPPASPIDGGTLAPADKVKPPHQKQEPPTTTEPAKGKPGREPGAQKPQNEAKPPQEPRGPEKKMEKTPPQSQGPKTQPKRPADKPVKVHPQQAPSQPAEPKVQHESRQPAKEAQVKPEKQAKPKDADKQTEEEAKATSKSKSKPDKKDSGKSQKKNAP